MDERLEQRLDSIERRLLAIEQATAQGANLPRVALPPQPIVKAEPLPLLTERPQSPSTSPSEQPVHPGRSATPPPVRVESIPEPPAPDDTFIWERKAAQQKLRNDADRDWRERLEAVNSGPAIDWAKIESLVAGRWYALAGGLVVTIGVALFVQYAVRQGWLGQIPGWARCALGGMFGIALLCAGEWARRKVNDWAAVGLTAAGLGSLYISSYAAYALYQLMTPGTTLLVLAGVAGIGLAISALTSLSVVGLVAMIGAYMAPFIASSGNAGYVYLPAYWLALLVVGQLLSITRGGTFAMCRWFGAVATMLLGAGWILKFGGESPRIGLAMVGGAWALFHAESSWTARRTDLQGALEYSESDIPRILESPDFFKQIPSLRVRPLVSVSASAWAASLGVYAARESHLAVPQSLAPGLIGTLSLILAFVLVGPSGILNPRPKTKRERLAAALCATAGALLVATVAIALSGFAQTIALTAIGLAALGAGRWLRTQVLDIYSGLVLLFAAGRVLFYDSWATAPNAPGLEVLGFYLTEWAAACAGIGVAWIAYAIVIALPRTAAEADSPEQNARFIPAHWLEIAKNVGLGIGITLLGASLIHQNAARESVACAILGTALVFGLTAALRRSDGLRGTSLVTLAGATACTLGLSWWTQRSGTVHFAGFVLVPQMWVAFANALVIPALAWILSEASRPWAPIARNIGLGIGISLLSASLMHQDSAHESIACLMIGTAVVFGLAAAFRRSDGLRIASLAALIAATSCTLGLGWWIRRPGTAEIAGLVLVPQMGVAFANGIAILAMAWILSEASWRWAQVAKVTSAFAVLLFVLGISHGDSSATSLCYAWLAICWICLLLARLTIGLAFEAHALLVWLIVLAAWSAKFAANDWIDSKAPPLLQPGLWIAFALAGTVLAIRKLAKPRLIGHEAKAKALAWWAATALVWASTSLEVARLSEMLPIDATARGAAVSIWWGMFAVILLVVGFWRDEPLVRRCGLGLLAVATGKALVLDLARVAAGWRALSIISLGLLMIVVSAVYARIAKRFAGGTLPQKPEDGGSTFEPVEVA